MVSKSIYIFSKRAREDIYTFTYHGQNGKEKIYILVLSRDKTGKRRHIYFYLPWTTRAREDVLSMVSKSIYIFSCPFCPWKVKVFMSFLARFVHGK
jgi:hypothetical protein